MNKILINTLIESLAFEDQMFRTLKGVKPSISPLGIPHFRAGRNSITFDLTIHHERKALKCYTQPLPFGKEICNYTQLLSPELIIRPNFYPEELWVGDRYTDVVVYDWVEGRTFDWWIRNAHFEHDAAKFKELSDRFIEFILKILDQEWRHGDVKPENIIVRRDGEFVFVDSDTIFAPSIPPRSALGTPHYIHPLRGDAYDEHIDDYSIALIVLSLEAMHRNIELFEGETMVVLPSENPPKVIETLFADNEALTQLYKALRSDSYKIENLVTLLQNV